MIFSLRQSLLLGFGAVLTLFIGAILFINNQITIIQNTQASLVDTRMPTVLAGEKLLDGVHHSLAGLRGYMILGGDAKKGKKLKAERAEGWAKIDAMLTEYESLSINWTEPSNLEHLDVLKGLVEKFRTAQQEVEDIAHTPNNLPAINLLFTSAAPKAQKVSAAITAIINEESTLGATPDRKALLKLFADSRGSFVGGLASIRAYLLSGNEKFKQEFLKKWDINEARFKQISERATLLSSNQRTQWDIYTKERAAFAPLSKQMFNLRAGEDWNQANYLLAKNAAPLAGEIKSILSKLATSQYNLKLQAIATLKHEKQVLATVGNSIAVISITLGILIALLLSRSLSNKLDNVVGAARQLSKGDLTCDDIKMGHFKEFNSLAKAFNNTKTNLNNLVSKILHSSDGLSSHTHGLENLLANSYKIANTQQENTHVIVNSMHEMSQTVEVVSSNTIDAANSAEDADKSTSKGHKVVSQTVTSITELASAIENAANTINQLGEETNAVDTILSAISGIADQTNLLALNAAIEAARAGEQGRGFAVVADEVRALAARTQESTIEIKTMLDRLKTGASNAVDVMSVGHQQAQESVEKANVASKTLENIAQEMKVIKDMNTQIASAAEQQNAVTLDMKSKVNRIDKGATEVSDSSKESIQSIKEISSLMDELKEGVAQFKI